MPKLRFSIHFPLIIMIILLIIISKRVTFPLYFPNSTGTITFNGSFALENVINQVEMGPRTPGSLSHMLFYPWVKSNFDLADWVVVLQKGLYQGHQIRNIIAKNSNEPPQIIIAAHYDSRLYADKDPEPSMQSNPVPGANDGASGVAILIELGRTLPANSLPIWLVFLDAEDNGNIPGWEWILGSRFFVSNLKTVPRAVIILDMVGDRDLNIYRELNSNNELTYEIWNTAQTLGFDSFFIDLPKYSIIDDHIPFIEAGIPAVDIIDIDYPYWHTTADTVDKISAESLEIVGTTILTWIMNQE
ncbi:MAG: M28 family peptidase [Chloroflexota bacterium]